MMWSLVIASILILQPGCVRSRECTGSFVCSPNEFCCDNGQCCSFNDFRQQNRNKYIAIALGINVPVLFLICCCAGYKIYKKHRNAQITRPTYNVSHTTARPIATGTQYRNSIIAPPSVYNTQGPGYPQQQHHPPSINQPTHEFTSSPPPYSTAVMNSAPTVPPPSYDQSMAYPIAHIGTEIK